MCIGNCTPRRIGQPGGRGMEKQIQNHGFDIRTMTMNQSLHAANVGGNHPAANPFRRLLASLRAASPWWERKRAVEELSAAGVDPGLLFRLLPDERSLAVRLAIIQAAQRATGAQIAEVTNALLGEIDYPDARVAAAAIRALGVLRADAARAEVINVLDDWCAAAVARPSAYHPFCIVKAAVGFLAKLGPPEVASHFVPLLAMRWPPVRACATWGIARFQYRPAAPFLIEALERCIVLPRRSEAEAWEARNYIQVLRRLGAQEAIPILIRTAREAVGLRSNAVQALNELGPEQAAPALVGLLADPGERLRRQLLRLMVKAGCRDASPSIRDLLHADRHNIRLAALRALARLQDPQAADEVRALCLTDPNPFVRPEAVRVLSSLLGIDAVPTLVTLVDDTNAMVRAAAAVELARLGAAPSDRTPSVATFLHSCEANR